MSQAVVRLSEMFIAQGFATALGVDIFVDYEPAEPNNAITIHEFNAIPAEYPGQFLNRDFQINVRNAASETAKLKAWSIFNYLSNEDMMEFFIGDRYFVLSLVGGPNKTGATTNYTIWSFDISVKTQADS